VVNGQSLSGIIPGGAVPEPASLALFAFGGLAVLYRRVRA